MSNQIVITSGAKVRGLNGVLTGTSGIVSSVPLGAANGVATLDSGGKVPVSQLPSSVVTYLGTWNAATNTPTLVNGVGDAGDMYICNVAGTVNFGAGPVTFAVGDWVLYGSGTWQKSNGQNGTVTSVAITESGDSLNITGSPITTSGTINIGFNGTNLQYVNGAGNLTTFPDLTGYVPYTGATQNVDLGVFDLTADLITGARSSFASSGGSDTFAINHSSGAGIALNITKGGNGEGLYINKTSGSGNAVTIIGTLEATTLVKNGGTSSQFLKADGTVDSSTYALDSLVVHLAGTETITGAKTFSGYTTFTSTVDITSGLTFSNSGFTLVLQPPTLSVNRTVTLPNATGTIALTSDLSSYVPYSGATGAVNLGFNSLTTNSINLDGNSASGLLNIKSNSTLSGGAAGYVSLLSGNTNQLSIWFGGGNIATFTGVSLSSSRTYTLPDASGTIALVGGSGVGTVTSVAALTIGTSGTDLSSTVANSTTTPVITLNVPTASATNRGALSSADWTTFNNKQNALTNPVTGTGTTNYLPKFTGASTIGNSILSESGYTLTQTSSNALSVYVIKGIGSTTGLWLYTNGANATLSNQDNGSLAFQTNGSDRLTIASTGAATFSSNLQAQSLTVNTADQYLQMNGYNGATTQFISNAGYSSAYNGLQITSNSNNANSLPAWSIDLGGYDSNFSNNDQFNLGRKPSGGNFTKFLTIASSGAATFSSSVTATSFFESSDSRLKTLIEDNYQTKGIASITPKLYTKNGKVELGYYAQDFVGILDSAVSKGSDDMLSLSYREVLVAKVYALEQRIKELENK